MLALVLAYLVIGLALNSVRVPSVLHAALGQLVAALFAVYLFWRTDQRASKEFQ